MIMITNEDDVVVKFFSHYLSFIVQHYMEGEFVTGERVCNGGSESIMTGENL